MSSEINEMKGDLLISSPFGKLSAYLHDSRKAIWKKYLHDFIAAR